MLAENYHSAIVEKIKADDFTFRSGRLTVHLAREFGFCYGVDRAVDYAYQTRERFPDRRVFLTGEIIHNPHVNDKLRDMGIQFLDQERPASIDWAPADDVVILPAFGVTVAMLQQLDARGCTLIDTTCGSVLNVWKNVKRYAEGGYTSVIHGKVWHEETQATASQAVALRRTIPRRLRQGRSRSGLRLHPRGRIERDDFLDEVQARRLAGFEPGPRPAADRPRQPDDDADVGVARDRRDAAARDARSLRHADSSHDAVSGVRHDLQRHPGSPGRRRRRC